VLAVPGDAEQSDGIFRRRPHPSTWSALEYTAHVADVLDHAGPAIRRIVTEDEPTFTGADHPFPGGNDERAVQQDYNGQDRVEVLGWLDLTCADLASILDSVSPDDWRRIGHFPFGDRDALTVARGAVHEGSHHLRDVQRVLADVRGRRA
jgi:hypothetical protein